MNTVKFYNGVDTIGGTSIVFQNEKERVIYGMGVAPRRSDFVAPTGFKERLLQKNCPMIDGIYKKELIESVRPDINIKTYDELNLDTYVFITHGHLDHMALIEILDPRVKIYVHQDAYNIHQAVLSANSGIPSYKMPDVYYYTPDKQYNIGEFTVTPILVDHDTISACSLVINFDGINVAYTGDYYYAGKHKDRIEEYIKKIHNIDVFITEATNMSFLEGTVIVTPTDDVGDILTYDIAFNNVFNVIAKETANILMLDPYNIEFLIDVYTENKKRGYNCLVQPSLAYVLKRFAILDVDVLITSEIDKSKYNSLGLTNKTFSLKDIDNIDSLCVYIDNERGIDYIFDNTGKPTKLINGFNKTNALNDKLKEMGVYNCNVHTSGHCTPGNLVYSISQIEPKQLMVIHTFKPEGLLKYFKGLSTPARKNFSYQVENKKLVCKEGFCGKGYLVSTELDNALTENGIISQGDINAVVSFKKSDPNNKFIINTIDILPDALSKIQSINGYYDYIVCSNGAAIYSKEGKLLNLSCMDKTKLLKLLSYLAHVDVGDGVTIDLHFDGSKKTYEIKTNQDLIDMKQAIISGSISNILALRLLGKTKFLSPAKVEILTNIIETVDQTFVSAVDNIQYTEVIFTKKDCNKGSALVFINQIEKSNTMTHIPGNFTDDTAIESSDRAFETNSVPVHMNATKVDTIADALETLLSFR